MNIASLAAPGALATGLVVGGIAGAASLQPSISHRSTKQQLMLTGGTAVIGVGIGAGIAKLGSLAGRVTPGGATGAFAAMAGLGLAAQTISNHVGSSNPAAQGVTNALGTTLALTGGAGLAVTGLRLLAKGTTHALPEALKAAHPLMASRLGGAAAVLVGAGLIGAAALHFAHRPTEYTQPPSRVIELAHESAARIGDSYDASGTVAAPLDTVAGSPRSGVTADELGKHGKRFALEAIPGKTIAGVMGDGVDPIRAYGSLQMGTTAQARVDATMAQAEKLGGFDGSRERILLITPTGSGFVDPAGVQAEEIMSKGRVASLAVQYNDQPSIKSTGKVPLAAETTKLLIEAVNARIAKMPEAQRPTVELYSESLGAWSQQEVFKGKGVEEMQKLGIDRALWVGTPQESSFRREAMAEMQATGGDVFRNADRIEDLDKLTTDQKRDLKYVALTHASDPVAQVDKARLGYQRPEWLPADGSRPAGIATTEKYYPGVTLAQSLIDLINGTHPVPGKFEAHSHDYRADLASFARVAYDHDGSDGRPAVTDAQLAGVTDVLVRDELERAAIMAKDPTY